VEVLFAGVGWVTFDPTPGAQAQGAGVAGTLRQLLDTLRMRWFRYVVEYDLRQQVSMVRRVQEAMRSPRVAHGLSVAQRLALAAVGLAVAVALSVWVWRRRRGGALRRRRTTAKLVGPSRLYARLLALLARAGHPKPPGATAQEFAEELGQRALEPAAAELVRQFVRCYYEARFGGGQGAGELERMLRELRHEVRRPARAAGVVRP